MWNTLKRVIRNINLVELFFNTYKMLVIGAENCHNHFCYYNMANRTQFTQQHNKKTFNTL